MNDPLLNPVSLFFENAHWTLPSIEQVMNEALHGIEDGELYLEYVESEQLVWDDGRVRSASHDSSQGFGLRAVMGEAAAYAHSCDFSLEALKRASQTVKAIKAGHTGQVAIAPFLAPRKLTPLYTVKNPLSQPNFIEKVALLEAIDRYLRQKDGYIRQVSISLYGEWQVIGMLRKDHPLITDIRPLVRLNISVIVEKNGRRESGSSGAGGRVTFTELMQPSHWQAQADEALHQAMVNVDAKPAPAGEMTVVVGPGWPGVLLHEAVGHGLESDHTRKGTSVFSSLLGQRVAAKGVTVIDDGTIADRRGSLTIDDEGTPTQRTVLIEDGILKGFLHDRQNGRLMGFPSTGNGRRESYAHLPMPRMTNTYMLQGPHTSEEIITSVDHGIYAVHFGGGQVDTTSGKFVFSASEAYLIEKGKITAPLKGATLIGNGPEIMQRISMIGNDLKLDPGIGTCGKSGQSVPVGVGQPTLKISHMIVGGTEC